MPTVRRPLLHGLAGLAVALVLAAPASAQLRPSAASHAVPASPLTDLERPLIENATRVGVLGGVCFDSEQSSQRCWVGAVKIQRYRTPHGQDIVNLATLGHRPGAGRAAGTPTALSFGGAATASTDSWPDKDPPPMNAAALKQGSDASHEPTPRVRHKGSYTFTAEVSLPIPVESVFLAEPFVGAGVGYVREGTPGPGHTTIQNTAFKVLTYGAEVAIRTNRADLLIHYRGLVFLTDEVTYISPEGTPFVVDDVKTVTTETLLLGLGFRF